MMTTRLKWLSAYFLIAGILGGLRTISSAISDAEFTIWDALISLVFISAYLYCGLKLKSLLPKWRRGIQILVAVTILSNLLFIYFSANVSKGFLETDTLGKILILLIFILPTTLCGYVIYQIKVLSKLLTQPVAETAILTVPNSLPPLEKRFYSNKYFLLSLPLIVALISQIGHVIAYLPVSWEVTEQITIYTLWGAIIFAWLYFFFIFYWLFRRRFIEAGLTLIGLFLGVTIEYLIIYLP